nr:MAG TPA: hypothetical protein [Caudoviricetes sp.]
MNKTLDWTHAIVSLIECHFVQSYYPPFLILCSITKKLSSSI